MSELRQRQPRLRDEHHLNFIRACPCCLCGDNIHTEAAHIRVGSIHHGKNPTGMAEKPSDKWTLPLCNRHHAEQHTHGDELEFWAEWGTDPFALAIIYQQTNPNLRRAA